MDELLTILEEGLHKIEDNFVVAVVVIITI
ncbi:unnamed protein product, partial [Rotaria magnacalcarata]